MVTSVSGRDAAPVADRESPEVTATTTPARRKRGRRPTHAERWTKVTVVLMDREVVFLDRLVADIRAASGAAIGRAHLIRALVDALAESDLDLTASRSEADLTRAFADRFGRRSTPTEPAGPPAPGR
jgi:hypothetical protein